MFTLLLLLALLPPKPIPVPLPVCRMATLTSQEAKQINGKRSLWRIALVSKPREVDGGVIIDVQAPKGDIANVMLKKEPQTDVLTVEATLYVGRFPSRVGEPESNQMYYNLQNAVPK